ncbi:MAG: pyruvate, phosphate dikinase [Chlorobi bacterium]|nr:pyruvate, phosphate dikinase [Chlorobiota bacterium]
MPFKVKEILLVATLYDAYSIEKEGRFSEHILGEYHQLNLTSVPRITGVSSLKEALDLLLTRHFDLVILMVGNDYRSPLRISKIIKKEFPYLPIYLLLNNNWQIPLFTDQVNLEYSDRMFVWNGDSKVFFAMVKHLEDKVNVENDTKKGMVKVILLVEDSVKYYSRYLPLLYNSVMEQTRRIIEDVSTDDLYKILRLRARPKILLATSYEEAIDIFSKYKEDLLCLITDVKFKKNGELNKEAGFELVKHIRSEIKGLPTIIQSSDINNETRATDLRTVFINKNSESLIQDIKIFIKQYLGFGDFVFKNANGEIIDEASSLRDFETKLDSIPMESLVYHGRRNHFSLWLMARGEIKIAKMINPVKVTDFSTPNEFRNYLKYVLKRYREESNIGRVVKYEESALIDESNIVSMGNGVLGGKGRGLAFLNSLIYNLNFSEMQPFINIRMPITTIIGTDEFDYFLDANDLHDKIYRILDYEQIKKWFINAKLSDNLMKKLVSFLSLIHKPIAVRSSSLFEDSSMQPFSGIFETFLLPNNHPDDNVRLKHLTDAIKLVYASIFSPNSRTYFEAVNYKIEEEKMAIVIQQVVGNKYESYYYPHISGTAQSHNYYPIAHMKPENGFSVAAIGLGKYVVEGQKTFRFSPGYPKIDMVTTKDLFKSSQVKFYAIDMSEPDVDLLKYGEDAGLKELDISEAEKHHTLNHCVSVYDPVNDRLDPGLSSVGPRIINFADILKYEYIPLAKTIELILDVVKEALGSPVEIEYAVDLEKDTNELTSFYLLQMKPLVGNDEDYTINLEKINKEKVILLSEKSMGNGKINQISDVIFIDQEKFDKMKTLEMAGEIEALNEKMVKAKTQYVLIGPGRWGTRDKFIGIPVVWPQISNAKIIVEVSLDDFPLDASLGSHFFHNVTSMNVGYFSINNTSLKNFISWDTLHEQELIEETKYFKHVRFKKPFSVIMDGKKQISVIVTN